MCAVRCHVIRHRCVRFVRLCQTEPHVINHSQASYPDRTRAIVMLYDEEHTATEYMLRCCCGGGTAVMLQCAKQAAADVFVCYGCGAFCQLRARKRAHKEYGNLIVDHLFFGHS